MSVDVKIRANVLRVLALEFYHLARSSAVCLFVSRYLCVYLFVCSSCSCTRFLPIFTGCELSTDSTRCFYVCLGVSVTDVLK